MNLNEPNRSILIRDLKLILSEHDDSSGDHCPWISKAGDFFITKIPWEKNSDGYWFESLPDFKVRMQTTIEGNGYVGREAAEDDEYVEGFLNDLLEVWKSGEEGESRFV